MSSGNMASNRLSACPSFIAPPFNSPSTWNSCLRPPRAGPRPLPPPGRPAAVVPSQRQPWQQPPAGGSAGGRCARSSIPSGPGGRRYRVLRGRCSLRQCARPLNRSERGSHSGGAQSRPGCRTESASPSSRVLPAVSGEPSLSQARTCTAAVLAAQASSVGSGSTGSRQPGEQVRRGIVEAAPLQVLQWTHGVRPAVPGARPQPDPAPGEPRGAVDWPGTGHRRRVRLRVVAPPGGKGSPARTRWPGRASMPCSSSLPVMAGDAQPGVGQAAATASARLPAPITARDGGDGAGRRRSALRPPAVDQPLISPGLEVGNSRVSPSAPCGLASRSTATGNGADTGEHKGWGVEADLQHSRRAPDGEHGRASRSLRDQSYTWEGCRAGGRGQGRRDRYNTVAMVGTPGSRPPGQQSRRPLGRRDADLLQALAGTGGRPCHRRALGLGDPGLPFPLTTISPVASRWSLHLTQ